MAETLDEIGLKYGTDKSSLHHNYLNFYESFMAPLRDKAITVLEIGVYQGASLRTWREYFSKAKIVGVDNQPNCKQFETEGIRIELADQSNLEHLARLSAAYGPFDLVIEDGSHMWEHQITSLRALFPFLSNGGIYMVEDLQTNYGVMQAKYRGVASQSCTDFLKSWMDLFVADDLIDIETVEDPFLRTYGRAIDFMTFHRRACALRKRSGPTDWRVSMGPPLAPKPGNAPRVVINAHFGLRGDIFGPAGHVDEGADAYTIQGLALQSETRALEYRVRFPDGQWSEWVGEGVFAGTRGQSLAITGFSARIAESSRGLFEVETRGLFVGGVGIDAGGDADCVAPDSPYLRGLQVTIRPVDQKPAAVAADEAAPVDAK